MSKFILLLTLPIISLSAKPIDFNFKDPKGVNNIIFQMDAPLESINGSADGISGNVSFDPKNPKTTKGTIYLNSKSLHFLCAHILFYVYNKKHKPATV